MAPLFWRILHAIEVLIGTGLGNYPDPAAKGATPLKCNPQYNDWECVFSFGTHLQLEMF